MRKSLLAMLFVASIATTTLTAQAKLELPALFSDHMVVQSGTNIPVWGWAAPGQQVTVKFLGQAKQATTNDAGKWTLSLDAVEAGGPHELVVDGGNTITIKDVLVGEVWLASGQSNMAFKVRQARNFDKEKAKADLPKIRMFTVQRQSKPTPQARCKGSWKVCSPETVGDFSAAAYFFGRHLHNKLAGVPVGLINSSWGGTAVEAWTSMDVQKKVDALQPMLANWQKRTDAWDPQKAEDQFQARLARWKNSVAKWEEAAATARGAGKKPRRKPRRPRKPGNPALNQNHPANLFNGMIEPLIPYAIKGAIWYQGEHNARTIETAKLYRTQLPLLINDWRTRWKEGDFPFAWVQLPNFKKRVNQPTQHSAWAVIRESMAQCLDVPNTGMAVTIDVGMANNIHPTNKQAVGNRLGRWAMSKVYGKRGLPMGPILSGSKVEGNTIVCMFKYARGLKLRRKATEAKGFAVAGEDHKWHAATAKIEGNKVIVSCPDVPNPVAVRYAWGDNPECNLVNRGGLPASPFRTDDWDE